MESQVRGNQQGAARPAANLIPPILNRRFEVWYKPSSAAKVVPIRDIKACYIGKLISLKVRLTPKCSLMIIPGTSTNTGTGAEHWFKGLKFEEIYYNNITGTKFN